MDFILTLKLGIFLEIYLFILIRKTDFISGIQYILFGQNSNTKGKLVKEKVIRQLFVLSHNVNFIAYLAIVPTIRNLCYGLACLHFISNVWMLIDFF